MLILADHLEVPSNTACLAVFRWLLKSSLEIWNISWITSNTSGQFFSLIFMRSFIAMMIFWVLSSAPCLELFSTAPKKKKLSSLHTLCINIEHQACYSHTTENNGWSLQHGQSVAICKAVLVRQNVRMVIRYSRSALSLQLNWVKLPIICYLLMIRWQLTAVNEQKLQFFCHLHPQS